MNEDRSSAIILTEIHPLVLTEIEKLLTILSKRTECVWVSKTIIFA